MITTILQKNKVGGWHLSTWLWDWLGSESRQDWGTRRGSGTSINRTRQRSRKQMHTSTVNQLFTKAQKWEKKETFSTQGVERLVIRHEPGRKPHVLYRTKSKWTMEWRVKGGSMMLLEECIGESLQDPGPSSQTWQEKHIWERKTDLTNWT